MTGQSLQLKLEALVNKVASVRVIANVELAQEQLEALQVLRNHCLNQALDDAEVRRDPRNCVIKRRRNSNIRWWRFVWRRL